MKNKERKGAFYSRNKGAFFARGEYLQYIDPADLLVGNILEKAYINSKINNIDIIQYIAIKKDKKKFQTADELEKRSIIKQPELSKEKLYDFSDLKTVNNYLFNKLIKKEKYLESLKYLEDEILKENLYLEEDYIQFISLLKVSESFLFIDQIGYAIIRNRDFESLMNEFDKSKMANRILHDKFIELKFIYKKTKDNEFDKKLLNSYFNRIKNLYTPLAKKVTEGYELYDELFDLLVDEPIAINVDRDEERTIGSMNELASVLKLDKVSRIELFDNANLFGTFNVSGMVVFVDGKSRKNEYRKFKITRDVNDDYGTMREVIYRRYFRVLKDKLESSSIEPKLFIFGIIHNDELTSERITEAENIVIFFMESYKHFIFIFFDFFEEFIPWNDIAVSSH